MFIPSSTIFINCCYILIMIFFLRSSVGGYVIDSNDLTNNLIDQQYGLNIPTYFYDRYVRTTKFPRIGRSLSDSGEELASLFDLSNEEYDNNNNNNGLNLIDERSVHFPRIGKRAFHNLLWANSRSNPHKMLDGQGRYHVNGYDYNIHAVRPPRITRHRTKRNTVM